MHRRKMSKEKSRRVYRRNTGVKTLNTLNPRKMRGGIRLG